jgi:hypothetical protein
MKKPSTVMTSDLTAYLQFLKERYHLYHASNVFFRDLHFGAMAFLESHNVRLSYSDSEEATRDVIGALESQGILKNIDSRSWLLDYPEYRKASKKAAPAVKPAAKSSPTKATSAATPVG